MTVEDKPRKHAGLVNLYRYLYRIYNLGLSAPIRDNSIFSRHGWQAWDSIIISEYVVQCVLVE